MAGVFIFSGVMNLLALTGSIYALQLYDRVLPSRSEPTLIGLSLLAAWLFLVFGLLDFCRGRVLSRIGVVAGGEIESALFRVVRADGSESLEQLQDADRVRGFLSGTGVTALLDLPWVPIYILVIYLIHPAMGYFAMVSAALLVVLAGASEVVTRRPLERARAARADALRFAEDIRRAGHRAFAIASANELHQRFDHLSSDHAQYRLAALDASQTVACCSKVLRLLMQSGIMGFGAWLAIRGEVTAGAMIAASVVMARALAPIDALVGHAKPLMAVRDSVRRLARLRGSNGGESPAIVALPRPTRLLVVENLTLVSQVTRSVVLREVSFTLSAGEALGVIGSSGSGKSCLVQGLIGAWPRGYASGAVRLDGALLEQFPSSQRTRDVGYLPQEVELLDGTIAEIIARLDRSADSEKVVRAARAAGVHEMIVRLPHGYDTRVGASGAVLSAGQRQRLALARALYGEPFLVVLDEPNSNLDRDGEAALNDAISAVRQRGGIAIVVAHRASALQSVDTILALSNGRIKAFGPKQLVLRGAQEPAVSLLRGSAGAQHVGLKVGISP